MLSSVVFQKFDTQLGCHGGHPRGCRREYPLHPLLPLGRGNYRKEGTGCETERTSCMSEPLSVIYVARHGETAWSLSGQHTGITDLPLTERGERNARRLGERLKGLTFTKVFTSPLQRASRTCELAGFGAMAEVDRELHEW